MADAYAAAKPDVAVIFGNDQQELFNESLMPVFNGETVWNDAATHGARVALGGEPVGGAGKFWQPTVLADVSDDARIMNEEPFDPVAVTQRFDRLDDVVAQANRLQYGLAAQAWTQSSRTAADIGDALEAGMTGINFVGLTGPEGGIEGLDAYLHHQYIAQA